MVRFGRIKILTIAAVLLCGLSLSCHAKESDRDRNSHKSLSLDERVIARSALLIDASTGEILFARNPDEPHYPASITKLITALLTYEKTHMQGEFVIKLEDTKVEPSSIPLKTGEEISVQELMKALLICSANDSALALARYVAGNVPDFVKMMNERALQLGCTGTHFTNPNGLPDPNEHTTASDMMRIFRAVLRIPELAHIMEQPSITLTTAVGTVTHKNHNKLLGKYEGMGPSKTGWTSASQHTFSAEASRDGHTLELIILKSRDKWTDARALFDYGFATLDERDQKNKELHQGTTPPPPNSITSAQSKPAAPVASTQPPRLAPRTIAKAPEPKTKIIPYKITKGDTLYTIGQKHNIAISDILHYNSIQDVNHIQPGVIIYLPQQVN